jgi:hypothetical protein
MTRHELLVKAGWTGVPSAPSHNTSQILAATYICEIDVARVARRERLFGMASVINFFNRFDRKAPGHASILVFPALV